jgi:hypothetical protein
LPFVQHHYHGCIMVRVRRLVVKVPVLGNSTAASIPINLPLFRLAANTYGAIRGSIIFAILRNYNLSVVEA